MRRKRRENRGSGEHERCADAKRQGVDVDEFRVVHPKEHMGDSPDVLRRVLNDCLDHEERVGGPRRRFRLEDHDLEPHRSEHDGSLNLDEKELARHPRGCARREE